MDKTVCAPIVFPCQRHGWGAVKVTLQKALEATTLDQTFRLLSQAYTLYTCMDSRFVGQFYPYDGLRNFIVEEGSEETERFLKKIVPTLVKLILGIDSVLPEPPLTVVPEQSDKTLRLSRHNVASIVACGFLCLFDDNVDRDEIPLTELNYSGVWTISSESNNAKLRMILNYFHRLSIEIPQGHITFRRLVIRKDCLLTKHHMCNSIQELCGFIVKAQGKIEDAGKNVLQVDFANKFLGGGVLNDGNVQEEIRFSICPELLSSMLIFEPMADNEAIIMEGCEQFSAYSGYGGGLKFAGNYEDSASKGPDGEIITTITAIDAKDYRDGTSYTQYSIDQILRDLNKAYIGFLQPYAPHHELLETSDPDWAFKLDTHKKRAIATGNWGCGIFEGDPQLKSLVQWMAASLAKCPAIIYYTFSDPLVADLPSIINLVQRHRWRVGELASIMLKYCMVKSHEQNDVTQTLFEFLLENYAERTQQQEVGNLLMY